MLHRLIPFVCLLLAGSSALALEPSPRKLIEDSKRIVFLGDSITAAGGYVTGFEAWLLTQKLPAPPKVINCGLPSETVSGLSEEGHAGGKFPRPDLAERLDRVLALTKPDLVIACYGMNCGIYEPFDKERFSKYQQGMTALKKKVEEAGAKFVVITPPFYDDQQAPKAFSYNEVLDRYGEWLISQRDHGWRVLDLHGPMTQYVQKTREKEPKFTVQPDGVHPNADGYWLVARNLIGWLGDDAGASFESPQSMLKARKFPDEAWKLVQQRSNLLRDAYVGTAGHKRPGVAKGLPVEEAEKQAAALTEQLQKLIP